MKKSKAKIVLIVAGILCAAFLLGSIVVQNLPEKSDQKIKTETKTNVTKEKIFNGVSSYSMGNAYGSCGMYYESEKEFLYYLDAATGERSIVCTKTNCEHEAGSKQDSMVAEKSDCEADFNFVEAYIPYGNKLYYIPNDPLNGNKPWEIWEQDLTGGNQKRVAYIHDKVNTFLSIYNVQCDGAYMVASFQELGYYNKKGKYTEYESYCQKAGLYIINMSDWSFQKVYITTDQHDDVLGKYASPYISQISLGSEEVALNCTYYDEKFDGKKVNKLPEKKQFKYMDKHVHMMQRHIHLSDGNTTGIVPFDGDHEFMYSGNWYMEQDYYGNFTAVQFRGEGNHTVLYSSPETGEKEYDSGYKGAAVTERSIFYTRYDKTRDSLDWYRYDRKTKKVECLAKPEASVIPEYSTKDYVYVIVFWEDDSYEQYAIPLKKLEKGTYKFPEKSEEKKTQEKQDKENNDPADTVVWGINDKWIPTDEAVNGINRYLKKKGYDFKVEFTSVSESNMDKIAEEHPELDILQVPGNRVDNNCSADALKSGYYEPLSDFLNNDGKKLKNQFSETEWKQVEVNREIYSVPNSALEYEGLYIAYSKKLKNRQDLKEADTLEKVEKVVTAADVKVKCPIVLLNSLADGNLSGFTDSDYCLGLALDHQTKKPELWYENKKVRSVYERFHTWYRRGWLSKKDCISSLAENDSTAWRQKILKKGEWLVAIGFGTCSEEVRERAFEIVRPKQTVFSKANLSTGVAASSNCKKQAEKFLALAYTDQKIADLMLYGTQKGHYQVKNNVVCDYSENQKLTFDLSRRDFGNQIAATPLDTDGIAAKPAVRKKYFRSYNVTESPLIGFQPDTGDYEKELGGYINAMQRGEDIWQSKDFDKKYDSLVKKLSTKRMKQYRDDVEKQIKAWGM